MLWTAVARCAAAFCREVSRHPATTATPAILAYAENAFCARRVKTILGSAILAMSFLAPPAIAQVQRSFANPGFEQPDLTTAGCRVYINKSEVPGWSTTHPDYQTENSGGCVVNGSAGTTNLGASPGPIIELWKTPRDNASGGTVNAPGGTQIAEL